MNSFCQITAVGPNYRVTALTSTSDDVPEASNIIPLPAYVPGTSPDILGSYFESGVFKDSPGGTVIYDPTP